MRSSTSKTICIPATMISFRIQGTSIIWTYPAGVKMTYSPIAEQTMTANDDQIRSLSCSPDAYAMHGLSATITTGSAKSDMRRGRLNMALVENMKPEMRGQNFRFSTLGPQRQNLSVIEV